MSELERLQKKWQSEWMKIDGVTGVAIGQTNGEACLVIYSSRPAYLLEEIPEIIEGVTVKIIESTQFNARTQL
ncbi:hypothetical protein ZX61_11125 [Vibrio sp. VPAP30]|nr:hypothetical protein ZX61_11125 [Vibrio sp. VPAP30]